MARLCIRITPNPHPDKTMEAKRFQPGDVVSLVDDDHQFSAAEMACGHYQIIDIPAVPQEYLTYLIAVGESADGEFIVVKRALSVDLAAPLKLPELTADVVALSMSRDAAANAGRNDMADAIAQTPELADHVASSVVAVNSISKEKSWRP